MIAQSWPVVTADPKISKAGLKISSYKGRWAFFEPRQSAKLPTKPLNNI